MQLCAQYVRRELREMLSAVQSAAIQSGHLHRHQSMRTMRGLCPSTIIIIIYFFGFFFVLSLLHFEVRTFASSQTYLHFDSHNFHSVMVTQPNAITIRKWINVVWASAPTASIVVAAFVWIARWGRGPFIATLAVVKKIRIKLQLHLFFFFSFSLRLSFCFFPSWHRILRQVSIATNAFRIIIGRTVYCRAFVHRVYHANAMQSARLVCAARLAVRARAKRVSWDRSVINAPAATVGPIVRDVHVMRAAQCQAVNVKRIVSAKWVWDERCRGHGGDVEFYDFNFSFCWRARARHFSCTSTDHFAINVWAAISV